MNLTPEMCVALAKLQGDLPEIVRDRVVDVVTKADKDNYSYAYATLSNVTKKIMPKLSENGLAYVAFPGLIDIGDPKGARMGLRYLLTHTSGGFLMGEFPLVGDGGIQQLGGRITFARRYALLAVTGLAPDEDDDAAAAQATDEAGGATAARKPRKQAAAPAAHTSGATAERKPRQSTRNAAEALSPSGPADTVEAPPPGDAPTEGYSEPRNPDDPISQPQQTKLILLFKDLAAKTQGDGAEYDRGVRLRMMSSIVGRPLNSGKDMTKGEAHDLIELVEDALQRRNPIEFLKGKAEARQAAEAGVPPAENA
jgi:hypothetical protein